MSAVVCELGASQLYPADVASCRGGEFLRDDAIAFFFEHLRTVSARGARFLHPSVGMLAQFIDGGEDASAFAALDLRACDSAFLAVSDSADAAAELSGSHWSLLHFSRDTGFCHYDSAEGGSAAERGGSRNFAAAARIAASLAPVLGLPADGAVLRRGRAPQQINNFDCGVHVCAAAEALAAGAEPSAAGIGAMRARLLALARAHQRGPAAAAFFASLG